MFFRFPSYDQKKPLQVLCSFLHDTLIFCFAIPFALAAADNVLIPVQAAYLPAKGLEQLLQTINKVRRQINPKLRIEGILLTMVDSRTNYSKDISNLIRENYGGKLKVYKTDIPRSVRAEEISAEGTSIFKHDPKGKVADAYRVLTKEVLNNAEKRRKHQLEQLR